MLAPTASAPSLKSNSGLQNRNHHPIDPPRPPKINPPMMRIPRQPIILQRRAHKKEASGPLLQKEREILAGHDGLFHAHHHRPADFAGGFEDNLGFGRVVDGAGVVGGDGGGYCAVVCQRKSLASITGVFK